jgi:hypothetical protein
MSQVARRFSGIRDACHHLHFTAAFVTDRDVDLENSGEHSGPGIVFFKGIFAGAAFLVDDAFFGVLLLYNTLE